MLDETRWRRRAFARGEPRYRNALWSFHHGSLSPCALFHAATPMLPRYEYVSHERILVDFRRGRKRNGSFDFRRSNFPFQSIFLSLDIAPRGRKRANSFNVVSLLFTKRKKIIRALINIYTFVKKWVFLHIICISHYVPSNRQSVINVQQLKYLSRLSSWIHSWKENY